MSRFFWSFFERYFCKWKNSRFFSNPDKEISNIYRCFEIQLVSGAANDRAIIILHLIQRNYLFFVIFLFISNNHFALYKQSDSRTNVSSE